MVSVELDLEVHVLVGVEVDFSLVFVPFVDCALKEVVDDCAFLVVDY